MLNQLIPDKLTIFNMYLLSKLAYLKLNKLLENTPNKRVINV